MKRLMQLFILMLGIGLSAQSQKTKIVIEADPGILDKLYPGQEQTEMITLNIFHWGDSTRTDRRYQKPVLQNGRLRWVIFTQKPVLLTTTGSKSLFSAFYRANPGDRIKVMLSGERLKFSGKGAAKYQLIYDAESAKQSIPKPVKYVVDILSVADYFKAMQYYDEQLSKSTSLIDSYKGKIKSRDRLWVKQWIVEWIEWGRLNAFSRLADMIVSGKLPPNEKYMMNDALAIWDSTQSRPWAKWLRSQSNYNNFGSPLYAYHYARTSTWLHYGYDWSNDSLSSKPLRVQQYYKRMKEFYSGVLRERVLNHLLDEQVIVEMGANHKMTKEILADYYTLPGFAGYKQQIKALETKSANSYWKDDWAPPFELTDVNGKKFSKNDLIGKIGVLDFWFTGCVGCIKMAPSMRKVEEYFKNDTNVVFVGISTDSKKDLWLKSVKEGKYTSGTGIQLYTDGAGSNHQVIKQYEVQSYPTNAVVDPFGKLVISHPPPDARDDDGKALIKIIEQQLLRLQDGPYVFYKDRTPEVWSINGGNVKIETVNGPIHSLTDEYNKRFSLKLRPSLQVPSSTYEQPDTLFALSDIEGNFDAFHQLLQANKLIDKNFKWTFGKGHLVFAGDMFDRGEEVTQCLWLVYALEEQAKLAGGSVHFILGNHEIMNLQGDHSYVKDKYKKSAAAMGRTLTQVYQEDSELGRWLRTKNIIEKIGDMLFMHGGVSRNILNLNVSVAEINQLARPYYADKRTDYGDEKVNAIMSKRTGPFWFRGFYQDPSDEMKKTNMQQLDSILQKFQVKRIITGHTIVADTISVHFNGKVINTDTHHASGKSEALLIEGDHYYRVNQEGKRVLLFVDEKKKLY